MKTKFRGAFNYRQTAKVLYAHANSERQAWLIFCRRLAKQDGVHVSVVMNLFNGEKPNFEITKEDTP